METKDPLKTLKDFSSKMPEAFKDIMGMKEKLEATMAKAMKEPKPISQKNFKDLNSGLGCAVTLFENGKVVLQFPSDTISKQYYDTIDKKQELTFKMFIKLLLKR